MFKVLSAPTPEELKVKVNAYIRGNPDMPVIYNYLAIVANAELHIPDNNEPTLGSVVTFAAYPDIRWVIQHIDGEDVYLATETAVCECTFGRNNITAAKYSESTLYAHCMIYLNETIPDLADDLEDVDVNGVTAKVFVPSRDQLNCEWDWPRQGASNRICQYNGSNSAWWTSSRFEHSSCLGTSCIWGVDSDGNLGFNGYPDSSYGFRPAIKMNYETMLKLMQPHTSRTFEPTLGQIIALEEYPNIAWEVQHIEGDYVYLLLATSAKICEFGANEKYADSVLFRSCAEFLHKSIPNIGRYLDDAPNNGVNAKVFVPSYKQLFSEWDWPKAAAANRICQYDGTNIEWWTSSPKDSSSVWFVSCFGNFGNFYPTGSFGFRPAIKLNLKNYLMNHPNKLPIILNKGGN